MDERPLTREQRIALRRQRIDARNAARLTKRSASANGPKPTLDNDNTYMAANTSTVINYALENANVRSTSVMNGIAALNTQLNRSTLELAGIRTQATLAEQSRRVADDMSAARRAQTMAHEEVIATRNISALQMRWPDILARCGLPHELVEAITRQRAACDAILGGKERLLSELRIATATAEATHTDALRAGRGRVDTMLASMAAATTDMAELVQREVNAIETALTRDQASAQAAATAELDTLFDARRALEKRLVALALAREAAEAQELDELYTVDSENYNRLKVKLETDVAILEAQLQKMRFTYTLNTEKLEYNYRVLTERDSDNKAALAAQKTRLGRLRTALGQLLTKYTTVDTAFEQRNAAVRDAFARVTRQYLELTAKLHAFADADTTLTSELITLHDSRLSALATRLAQADRIIGEQILGEPQPPGGQQLLIQDDTLGLSNSKMNIIKVSSGVAAPSSYSSTIPKVGDSTHVIVSATTTARDSVSGKEAEELQAMGIEADDNSVPADATIRNSSTQNIHDAADVDAIYQSAYPSTITAMLHLINDECKDVLWSTADQVEVQTLQSAGDLHGAQQRANKATLHALKCTSLVELQELLSFLLNSGYVINNKSNETSIGAIADNDMGENSTHVVTLEPDMNAEELPSMAILLARWIQNRQQQASGETPSALTPPSGIGSASKGDAFSSSVANNSHRRRRSIDEDNSTAVRLTSGAAQSTRPAFEALCARNDERVNEAIAEWNARAGGVSPDRVKVWRALEDELMRFQTVVASRYALVEELDTLTATNKQLKLQLAGYLYQERRGPHALKMKIPPSLMLNIPATLQRELQEIAASSAVESVPPALSSTGVMKTPLNSTEARGMSSTGMTGSTRMTGFHTRTHTRRRTTSTDVAHAASTPLTTTSFRALRVEPRTPWVGGASRNVVARTQSPIAISSDVTPKSPLDMTFAVASVQLVPRGRESPSD